nr:Phosphotidylinositol phosphatase PTPRQ [Hymenolepis microstoma]
MRCYFYLSVTLLVAMVKSQKPPNVKLRQVGNNRASLTWDEAISPEAKAVGYLIYFKDGKREWKAFAISKRIFVFPFRNKILKATVGAVYANKRKPEKAYHGERSNLVVIRKKRQSSVPLPPQNVKLQQVGDHEARLTFDAVTSSGVNVLKYIVYYKEGNSHWKILETRIRNLILPFVNENLEASVSAYYTLPNRRDKPILGVRSNSASIRKTRQSSVPPTPQNVMLQQVGDDKARITWNAVTYSGVQGLRYLVSYIDGNSHWTEVETPDCELYLTFKGDVFWAAVAAYYTRFNGREEKIQGRRSTPIGIRKVPRLPVSPPQNVQLQQFGDERAHLSWKAVDSPGVTVVEYVVSYNDGNTGWFNRSTTACDLYLPFKKEDLWASVAAYYKRTNVLEKPIRGEESPTKSIQKNHKYSRRK